MHAALLIESPCRQELLCRTYQVVGVGSRKVEGLTGVVGPISGLYNKARPRARHKVLYKVSIPVHRHSCMAAGRVSFSLADRVLKLSSQALMLPSRAPKSLSMKGRKLQCCITNSKTKADRGVRTQKCSRAEEQGCCHGEIIPPSCSSRFPDWAETAFCNPVAEGWHDL